LGVSGVSGVGSVISRDIGTAAPDQKHPADHQRHPGDAGQAERLLGHAHDAEVVEDQAQRQLARHHQGDGQGHADLGHAPGGGHHEDAAVQTAHPAPGGQSLHRLHVRPRLQRHRQQPQRHRTDEKGDEGRIDWRPDRAGQSRIGRPLQRGGGAA